MESGLRRALMRAGVKLFGGLALVVALVGIRVITAEPAGVAEGVATLERLEEKLEAERAGPSAAAGSSATSPQPSRPRAPARAERPASDPRSGDDDRLVSCRIGGALQFMRAADCLARGGDSTDFDPEK